MMRCGETLGTLDWNTDKIYLLSSTEAENDQQYLDEINKGRFIIKR